MRCFWKTYMLEEKLCEENNGRLLNHFVSWPYCSLGSSRIYVYCMSSFSVFSDTDVLLLHTVSVHYVYGLCLCLDVCRGEGGCILYRYHTFSILRERKSYCWYIIILI